MKKEIGISVLLFVLCAVTSILNPKFLSPINLFNTANLIGLYGVFSLGLGLVIITGGIDLPVSAHSEPTDKSMPPVMMTRPRPRLNTP